MNRADRRKLGVGSPRVYTLTDAQLDKIRKDAVHKALKDHASAITQKTIDDTFLMLCCIPVIVMGDKHGWRHKRCDAFLDECLSWFEDVQNDVVTLTQIIEEAQTYTTYRFQRDDDRNAT